MLENYQVRSIQQPTGATLALDLLATVTSVGTVTGGVYHVANSVWGHVDFDSAYKQQTIAVTPTQAIVYTLTVGAVVLTSTALGATPTLAQLITALQADADYAAAPFTIAGVGSDVVVTWKTVGTQVASAVMTDTVPTAYTTVTVNLGAAVSSTCTLLAAGERNLIIPDGKYLSFIKAASQSDGIIRLTLCQ